MENDPKYGKVYRIGNNADLMEMTRRENILIFMAHPRTKGSQGFPDAIRNTAHFRHENYAGAAGAGAWGWISRRSVSRTPASCRCSTT